MSTLEILFLIIIFSISVFNTVQWFKCLGAFKQTEQTLEEFRETLIYMDEKDDLEDNFYMDEHA